MRCGRNKGNVSEWDLKGSGEEFSVCFRAVWTLADVSVGFFGWNSGCGKERSSLRKGAGVLLVPTSAALLLSIPGDHSPDSAEHQVIPGFQQVPWANPTGKAKPSWDGTSL